jgi:hypothetical protein
MSEAKLWLQQDSAAESRQEQAADQRRQAATLHVETRRQERRRLIIVLIIVMIVVVAVVVPIVVTQNDGEEDVPDEFVDYSTGVSLVTYYGIEAAIRSRLARTKLTMEVANALDCSSIHSITLQLPLAARVASLQTISSNDGCITHGQVQKLEDARESFLETAAQGLPGAYIEEQDSSTYSLQVAIPPLGTARVELVLEEVLRQRLGEVEFQIPLAPNEEVDQIVLDLTVEDVSQDFVTELHLDLEDADIAVNGTILSHFHLDLPDAREYTLPKVLRGWYIPGEIPERGLLYTDGTCFEHFFHPTSLEPMPKNLVFVLDTSASMETHHKLSHVKNALTSYIDTLTPQDTFTIQTFSRRGTEDLWGSAPGTDVEKTDAKEFIGNLSLAKNHYKTNLHEAFLEALLRAKRDAKDSSDDAVTILMLLSDGMASSGETNRPKIAEDVYKLNQEGTVKIFSLGFQDDADMELLDAIAIMNGGVTAPILQGYADFASQMESFFESEFGTVLLSDVQVALKGEDVTVFGETQQTFPLLADGYEVVVRGLLDNHGDEGMSITPDFLTAVTTAATTDGKKKWSATAVQDSSTNEKISLCFRSYAHSRITELLRLRDAAKFLGTNFPPELVSLAEPCTTKLADCIEEEALTLAIEASVVAKGLTGMVTVDDENCLSFEGETEICRDGSTTGGPDGGGIGSDDYDYEFGGATTSIGHVSLLDLILTMLSIWFTLKIFF